MIMLVKNNWQTLDNKFLKNVWYAFLFLFFRAMSSKLRDLYPELEPFDKEFLKVSDTHSIYVEQSGNKTGKPVIFV